MTLSQFLGDKFENLFFLLGKVYCRTFKSSCLVQTQHIILPFELSKEYTFICNAFVDLEIDIGLLYWILFYEANFTDFNLCYLDIYLFFFLEQKPVREKFWKLLIYRFS